MDLRVINSTSYDGQDREAVPLSHLIPPTTIQGRKRSDGIGVRIAGRAEEATI